MDPLAEVPTAGRRVARWAVTVSVLALLVAVTALLVTWFVDVRSESARPLGASETLRSLENLESLEGLTTEQLAAALGLPLELGTPQREGDVEVTANRARTVVEPTESGPVTEVTVEVTVKNLGATDMTYGSHEWVLEYPDSRPNSSRAPAGEGALPISATLAPGESASGTVTFLLAGEVWGRATVRYLAPSDGRTILFLRWAVPFR